MKKVLWIFIAALLVAIPASAALVDVEMTGSVEWNFLRSFPMNQANTGDPVTIKFQVDSDNYMNSPNYPVRGYVIDRESFLWTGGPASVGMTPSDPYGRVPYFVIRDNDPLADGFFISNGNIDWPFPGIETTQNGFCGGVEAHMDIGYDETPLNSLDILEAAGTYDFDHLTRFYTNGVDCGFEAFGILFEKLTITIVPTEVPVDVKPGSCPNPLNTASRGVLPVAILGTADLDASQIDPASLKLAGVSALRSSMEDVGTPFDPYVGKFDCDYDCNDIGPDGMMDMTMKFSRQDVLAALGNPGENVCMTVQVTGNFKEEFGGLPIVGEDVIGIMTGGGGRPTVDRLVTDIDRELPDSNNRGNTSGGTVDLDLRR
jgi:hypothetical protein